MIHIDKGRWAHFSGKTEAETVSRLIGHITAIFEKEPTKPICLFFSSGGGESIPGFSFYEFIRNVLKPNLQTVATGEVGSIALLMYMAGSERFVTRNSTFFVHEFGVTFAKDSRFSLSEVKSKAIDLEIDQEKYISIVTGATDGKLTPAGLRDMMKRVTTITAEQAVEIGIAHEVLD